MSDVFRAKGIFGDIEGVMVDVRGFSLTHIRGILLLCPQRV
jgi:hypothetical protein